MDPARVPAVLDIVDQNQEHISTGVVVKGSYVLTDATNFEGLQLVHPFPFSIRYSQGEEVQVSLHACQRPYYWAMCYTYMSAKCTLTGAVLVHVPAAVISNC